MGKVKTTHGHNLSGFDLGWHVGVLWGLVNAKSCGDEQTAKMLIGSCDIADLKAGCRHTGSSQDSDALRWASKL